MNHPLTSFLSTLSLTDPFISSSTLCWSFSQSFHPSLGQTGGRSARFLHSFVCLISLALCCAFVLRSLTQIQCQVSLSVLNKSFSLFFSLSRLEGIKSSFTLPTQTPFNKNSLSLLLKSDKIPSIPEDEAERVCERKISPVVMRGQLWGPLAAFDTPLYFAHSTEKK